jgi:hypothetical protein
MNRVANIVAGIWVLTVSAVYYLGYFDKIKSLFNALISGQPH